MYSNGKRSLRQFQCNDVLWATFQRMAEEQERDISELVSDAMNAYAQLSGYQTDVNEVDPASAESTPPPPMAPARPRPTPSTPLPPSARLGRSGGTPGPGLNFVPPSAPPPPPRAAPVPDAGTAGPPPLYLVFDNQKYRIDKDQFIIGRGAKSSDLPIKDGNISRKHAAVIRRNGTYFIKDLGSTNGIDFKGMRIDNKRIDEGDTFHLCDYELKFTYKR
jgi:FHA domain